MKPSQCPCNSMQPYIRCCGRYHKGKIPAPTAEALMRSRFSAYVLNEIQYIYRTWDETTRPPLKVLREDSEQQFTQLEIIDTDKGNVKDETGTVDFIASYIIKGSKEIYQHHENSHFIKRKGRWIYIDEQSKIGID